MHHQSILTHHSAPRTCDSRSDTSTENDEREQHTDQHPSLTELTKTISSKAKSSLCRNYTQKGFCPYDKKCQFAHGPEQLRINMETNRSYKTKGCHAFAKKGYCCYGQRCNFIHERTVCEDARQKWAAIYSNHRSVVKGGEVREASRLLELLGA